MQLEKQVANLELSKKLKELGVKQESLFWWSYCPDGMTCAINKKLEYTGGSKFIEPEKDACSAYTVAELGEMLPMVIGQNGEDHFLNCFRPSDYKNGKDICSGWVIGYENGVFAHDHIDLQEGKTEANARAKMLIYLIENKLIEV